MQEPFISVVIPTYNSEHFITKTLETVFAQTYNNYEVIVSDDGSTDNTVDVVKSLFLKYPIRNKDLLINDHEGPGAARNRGVKAASGDWVAFLDSDDLWYREKLYRVACYICENDVDLVCHSVLCEVKKKQVLVKRYTIFNNEINPFISLYRDNSLTTSAVTVKKDLLFKAGLFDTGLPSAQDYDLWLKLGLLPNFKIEFIKEPLSVHVSRHVSISADIEQRFQCLLKIDRKYYETLKVLSRFPRMERARFRGRIYSFVAFALIRKGFYCKGIIFLFYSVSKWPFRYEWFKVIVSYIRYFLSLKKGLPERD